MNQSDILPAPVLDPLQLPDDKWQRERLAFLHLLPELMRTHPNQYVAIHEGRVVASGAELAGVALEAYSRYGYIPIYVDLVTDQPLVPIRIREFPRTNRSVRC